MAREGDSGSAFDFSSAFRYGPSEVGAGRFNRSAYRSAFTYRDVPAQPIEDTGAAESGTSWALRGVLLGALHLALLSTFPLSLLLCLKRVRALERVVLTRLGRLQPTKGPGWLLVLPLADRWTRVDLRPRTLELRTPQLLTRDGGVVEVAAEVEWRVAEPVRFVVGLRGGERVVEELALHCLRNVVSEKDLEDLETGRDSVAAQIKDELDPPSSGWGLEVTCVHLLPVRIVQAARPFDAVGVLMTALRAVGTADAAAFPGGAEESSEPSEGEAGLCGALGRLALSAQERGSLRGCSATVRLDVAGKHLCCSVRDGVASVFESPSPSPCDASLALSEPLLREMLAGRPPPLHALSSAQGDWRKMAQLAQALWPTP